MCVKVIDFVSFYVWLNILEQKIIW